MPKTILNEEDFASFKFDKISIQALPNGKYLLIVMLEDKDSSINFLNILKAYKFNLMVSVNDQTGRYFLNFQFEDTDFDISMDTGRTIDSYPLLQKFENNNVHYISTGVWTGSSEQGRTFEHNQDIQRLGALDIGSSFQQAIGVQFVSFGSDEPSAVILTFNDYAHIFEAEANEAYNKLLEFEMSRPLLEISPQDGGLVNLRIWDILIDLDIKINGLKYSTEELDIFLSNTDEGLSFAFALGFPSTGNNVVNMASTKRDEVKILTFFGYKYIKYIVK